MKIEIRETTVLPDENGAIVRLQISDAPLLSEDAAIRLILAVRVPAFQSPLLAQLEREAMKAAIEALRGLVQDKAKEIQEMEGISHNLDPVRKR
jgi:hypothetical protein